MTTTKGHTLAPGAKALSLLENDWPAFDRWEAIADLRALMARCEDAERRAETLERTLRVNERNVMHADAARDKAEAVAQDLAEALRSAAITMDNVAGLITSDYSDSEDIANAEHLGGAAMSARAALARWQEVSK